MPARAIRLLSFNLQLGLHTARYSHYLTRAWRHVLPSRRIPAGLAMAADISRDYDFVALQEADAGSFRTLFLDQVAYLAREAEYPHHGLCVTRNLRPVARHCLGYLSRWPSRIVEEYGLPGALPGRRVLRVSLEAPQGALDIYIVHLSLDSRTQTRQLDYLLQRVEGSAPSLIVGDFNCEAETLRDHPALRCAGFQVPTQSPLTFPSWAPRRAIDHVLVSPHLQVHDMHALGPAHSDHLPLAASIGMRF